MKEVKIWVNTQSTSFYGQNTRQEISFFFPDDVLADIQPKLTAEEENQFLAKVARSLHDNKITIKPPRSSSTSSTYQPTTYFKHVYVKYILPTAISGNYEIMYQRGNADLGFTPGIGNHYLCENDPLSLRTSIAVGPIQLSSNTISNVTDETQLQKLEKAFQFPAYETKNLRDKIDAKIYVETNFTKLPKIPRPSYIEISETNLKQHTAIVERRLQFAEGDISKYLAAEEDDSIINQLMAELSAKKAQLLAPIEAEIAAMNQLIQDTPTEFRGEVQMYSALKLLPWTLGGRSELNMSIGRDIDKDKESAQLHFQSAESYLNDRLREANYGNASAQIHHLKESIIYAIYRAAYAFVVANWNPGDKSGDALVEYRKKIIDDANRKFAPFFHVDKYLRVRPYESIKNELMQNKLYALEDKANEVLSKCNRSRSVARDRDDAKESVAVAISDFDDAIFKKYCKLTHSKMPGTNILKKITFSDDIKNLEAIESRASNANAEFKAEFDRIQAGIVANIIGTTAESLYAKHRENANEIALKTTQVRHTLENFIQATIDHAEFQRLAAEAKATRVSTHLNLNNLQIAYEQYEKSGKREVAAELRATHVSISDKQRLAEEKIRETQAAIDKEIADMALAYAPLKDKNILSKDDIKFIADAQLRIRALKNDLSGQNDILRGLGTQLELVIAASSIPSQCDTIHSESRANLSLSQRQLNQINLDELHQYFNDAAANLSDRSTRIDNLNYDPRLLEGGEYASPLLVDYVDRYKKTKNRSLTREATANKALRPKVYALAQCHAAVNALMNLDYWQNQITRFGNDTVHEPNALGDMQSKTIPGGIVPLLQIAKDSQYDGWQIDPVKANALLTALQSYIGNHKNSTSGQVHALYQAIEDINTPSDNTDFATYHHYDGSTGIVPTALYPFISNSAYEHHTQGKLNAINPKPPFFQRNPILKKVLIGAAIGLGIAVAATGIGAAVFFASAAAATFMTGVAAATVSYFGAGGAIALAAGAAATPAVVGATGAAIRGKWVEQKQSRRQQADVEAPRDDAHAPLLAADSLDDHEAAPARRTQRADTAPALPAMRASQVVTHAGRRRGVTTAVMPEQVPARFATTREEEMTVMTRVRDWMQSDNSIPQADKNTVDRLLERLNARNSSPDRHYATNYDIMFFAQNSADLNKYLEYKTQYLNTHPEARPSLGR